MDPKVIVITALTALMNHHDSSAIPTYFGPTYVQHSAMAPDGVAGLRAAAPMFKHAHVKVVRVLQDGNFVVTHSLYTGLGPKPLVAFDIFRVNNGKIVEHWDALQPAGPPNASGHTELDGATSVTDLDETEANRAVMPKYLAAFFSGKISNIRKYASDSYIQHNPMLSDGLMATIKGMRAMSAHGMSITGYKVHRELADGNFVLLQSEALMAGHRTKFYDLFRLHNGKVVEHWDVIEPIPMHTKSGHDVF